MNWLSASLCKEIGFDAARENSSNANIEFSYVEKKRLHQTSYAELGSTICSSARKSIFPGERRDRNDRTVLTLLHSRQHSLRCQEYSTKIGCQKRVELASRHFLHGLE